MMLTRLALVSGFLLLSGGCAADGLTAPRAKPTRLPIPIVVADAERCSPPPPPGRIIIRSTSGCGPSPLFVLDGRVVAASVIRKIDLDDVESLQIFKAGQVLPGFGAAPAHGMIVITMKPNARKHS